MADQKKAVQIRIVAYIIVIVLFLGFGAFCIYTFEREASLERKSIYANRCKDIKNESINNVDNYIKDITKNILSKSSNKTLDDRELLKNLITIIEKIDDCHRNFNVSDVKEIHIWNAMSLTYTLSTTLGYGDIYPLTDNGKIFEILFTLIAIPLVISFYVDLSELYIFHVIEIYYKTKLYFQKKFLRRKISQVVRAKKMEIGRTRQAPKVYVSVGSLIIILFVCTLNHFYQSKLAGTNDDFIYSITYVYENFGLIGLGYNVPTDTFLYLTRELPLMFIGICLYGQYINIMVNTIRNVIPRTIKNIRSKVDKNSTKFTLLNFLIYEQEDKHMGVLADYRTDGHKKPEIFIPVTVSEINKDTV